MELPSKAAGREAALRQRCEEAVDAMVGGGPLPWPKIRRAELERVRCEKASALTLARERSGSERWDA